MAVIPMDTTELQLAIKERFRLLVVANKGPTACERILGFSQSHISEAMSPHRLDRMPRADHISLLEAACGQLIVTSFMAGLQGYDVELQRHSAGDLPQALSRAIRECAEAHAAVAISPSSKIDEIMRQRVLKEISEGEEALANLKAIYRAA